MGAPFFDAMQRRGAPGGATSPTAGPPMAGRAPGAPSMGNPSQVPPGSDMTSEAAQHIAMATSILEQMVEQGVPLDQNVLVPEIQSFSQALTLAAASGEEEAGEAGFDQETGPGEQMHTQGPSPIGPMAGRGGY